MIREGRRLSHLPGPCADNLISGHGDYLRRVTARGNNIIMFDVWLQWAKKYGPVFKYRHYHRYVVPIVYGAQHIRSVLHDVSNKREILRDSLKFYQGEKLLGEDGILVSSYCESWRLKKSILRQFLNPGKVAVQDTAMISVIDRALSKASERYVNLKTKSSSNGSHKELGFEVDDLLELLQTITSDVLGQCLFGIDFGYSSQENTEFSDIAMITTQIAKQCFAAVADPTRKFSLRRREERSKTMRSIRKLRETARTIIGIGSPLTNKFLEVFPDIENIIDDISSLLFAGQDTTSNTLTYALAHITHNQHVQEWLREEISQVSSTAKWEEIDKLARLNAVINETLRLYPSAPTSMRTLHQDKNIWEYEVPGGSTVWLSPYTSGRNSAVWERADLFLPQRFLNLRVEQKEEFFPFLAGPHQCSGRHLALVRDITYN